MVLAEKEPVRDRDDAVLVLRRGWIERLAGKERGLGHAAVAGLEHQLRIAYPRVGGADLVGIQARGGCSDVFEREPRRRESAVPAEEDVADLRRRLGRRERPQETPRAFEPVVEEAR